ncbi:protein translocase subunit SecD [Paenibacillus polymyxa]|uniref:protein translocase subunit SecD n=1 Tax=Paenibacillus polymyxa TaxID=1406 RepID=UPI0007EADC8F|nr:protein translocase subunit SecD [Paenibacillus polymyxa]MBE3648626.1 protein translocase subunit SecD [Paenibacillus polymyxa]OAZ41493.1 protein-export membrane protein SecD [Paenibacillus polymyxa]
MKRILSFIVVVLITTGVMVGTSPGLLKSLKLGLDLKGGFEILYEAQPLEAGQRVTSQSLIQTAQSLERRINALGTTEPEVTTEGTNRIRVRLAGVSNEAEVRSMLKKPAELTFRSATAADAKKPGQYSKIELRGNDFVENGAVVGYDQLNQPEISIKVKDKAKFAEITKRLLNKELAIFLDDELLSAPTVRGELTDGSASITGSYTRDEANKLADTINLGALPLKLTEKYSQSVGATLGQLSLDQTIRAGLIGSIIILIFMIAMFRVPGLVASFCLIVHTWLVLAIFYLGGFVLTLPGIAAFVLGIGMAVDANIITYERIKEEIKSGKTIRSSVIAGSKASFRTVMDANITTIIAAAVMFGLGTGSVRGFALVLIVDIVVSILTNIFFSRFLLNLLVKADAVKKAKYFGVKESDISAL